ncbi:MarR family winged helix-turn-helix transcriptional regulator [Paracoccus nototheniae]|uniref:MarR family winged helix-turn-helix transcriptional regulator n=1 Tax=Paracoccus nototheniae TaxID=2489002 RepID=A0ABW4DUU4_9RHOB|nr:MarR family transcriptional regulator [Paracoccus nototheniae]
MTDARLTDQLSYLIARANRMVEEDLARRLQPGGLAIEQFRVLKALEQDGPSPMGGLAARVLVEPATLTKIIDRMTSEGLVFRLADPKDRRKVMVALAPKGIALGRDLRNISTAHDDHIAQALPGSELSRIKRILMDLDLS